MSPKSEPTKRPSQNCGNPRPLAPTGDSFDSGSKTYRFEIFRHTAAHGDPPRFQVYDLAVDEKISVLEALLRIQDEQDPSLGFRYSCRGAICGSCAMSINGKLNLACRVQLQTLTTTRIVLEPLPGFEVLKDLIVDLEPFWAKYERIRPWLHAEISTARENPMSEAQRQRIDQYVNCILCGLCYGACPVSRADESFTGPAVLAKLYRFLADSRESRGGGTLQEQNSAEGIWGCHTVMACIDVCPKNVRPTDGVRGLRWQALSQQMKKIFRSK